MTVATAPTPLSYAGNGSTTSFAVTWKYNAKSHVVATLRSSVGVETVWVLATNYTLTDPGDSGTLTAVVAPATGQTLVIALEPPNTQSTDLPLGGEFPSTSVEDGLDLSAQRDGYLLALFNRSLRVPKSDTQAGSLLEIPIDSLRASKFLAFDANGKPIGAAGTSANLGPVTAFINTLLDDIDAAVARATLVAERKFVLNVLDYGAVGDGTVDDTTAIQNALNAVTSSLKRVYFPAGTYKITAALTITNACFLFGDGPTASVIKQNSTTLDGIQINTVSQVVIEHLSVHQAPSAISGSGILIAGSGGVQTQQPKIANCYFKDNWIAITVAKAAQFNIISCFFNNQQKFGVVLSDTLSNDSEISGCHFGTGIPTATAGITHGGCPGLRVVNNKFLGFIYGYQISLSENTSTVNIVGNSFENQATAGIQFQQAVGGKTIGSVVISGNQFAQHPTGISIDSSGTWVSNVAVTGNTFNPSVNGILFNGGNRWTVSGNQFTGGTNGIACSSAATEILLTGNSFYGVTNPFSGSVSNFLFQGNSNAITVANLGAPINGSTTYCPDGTVATPVAGGGPGCFAKRVNGQWAGN